MCSKANIDERILNVCFLRETKSRNFVFFNQYPVSKTFVVIMIAEVCDKSHLFYIFINI